MAVPVTPIGVEYNQPTFTGPQNQQYNTVAAMQASIAKLKAAGVDLTTMEYGDYQRHLRFGQWSPTQQARWQPTLDKMREHLSAQPNADSVPGVGGAAPTNKWDLLHATIRKCFSDPPTPFEVRVVPQPVGVTTHTITYGWTDQNKFLTLTIACPF
jgi:hypothetical protein